MKRLKTIGIVAHDARKNDIVEWVDLNSMKLANHKLVCTGTTGLLIDSLYKGKHPELNVQILKLKSGPLGGDQQMGALIASGDLDILIFFTDPMTIQPHDVDIKALERMCVVYNIVLACTRSTADFVISSCLFNEEYNQKVIDYKVYLKRNISH